MIITTIMMKIMIVVNIIKIFMAINYLLIYILVFLYIRSSGSANVSLQSLLGHSTGEFQALQLIDLAAFGAMD